MTWEDRDWNQGDGPGGSGGAGGGGRGGMRPGGDWRGTRSSLDNPMSWSLRIGRFFGIEVRVHIVFVLYILVRLFGSLGTPDVGDPRPMGAFFVIIGLAGLFFLVLLHEFGHCFACRSTGGSANEILMWPLGGLAYCMPPHRWKAHLWTVAGGPLVNVALMPLFAIALGSMTGSWGVVAFPGPWAFAIPSGINSNTEYAIWLIADMNMMLLIFNLLPMFPLDGGRAVQCLLWPKLGYTRSMRISVRIGYIAAIALGLYAVVKVEPMLIMIAIFAGFTCYNTYRQLKYTEEVMGFDYAGHAMAMEQEHRQPTEQQSKRAEKKAEKREDQQRQDEKNLDRLLDKIAREGMGSLSAKEKRWLESQSKRKQDD